MRVFTVGDAQRAYFEAGLPKMMWEYFEGKLIEHAKVTKTTGRGSQNNRWNAHLKQMVEEAEIGYQKRELEWIIMFEAVSRGYPVTRVALKDGTVTEVPKDPHGPESEVSVKQFSILLDVLNEIAYDNGVVLREDDDKGKTSEDAAAGSEARDLVPDSGGEGPAGEGESAASHDDPRHEE